MFGNQFILSIEIDLLIQMIWLSGQSALQVNIGVWKREALL